MKACSVAAKRLKEQEAEESYQRSLEDDIWEEAFRNLKRHPLPWQIITVDERIWNMLTEQEAI